jgi:GNAT superfamily N-acetyltransferase
MDIEIRPYCDADQDEWMLAHARIMTLSQSWNYCIQERPTYAGNESTCLVACHEGKIIAITDTIYDNEPGEICLIKDRRGGYVTEFGRLPEYAGCSLGKRMMHATMDAAISKGVTRLEYWSQDPGAHMFYEKIGMHEIGRHYRFRMDLWRVPDGGLGPCAKEACAQIRPPLRAKNMCRLLYRRFQEPLYG